MRGSVQKQSSAMADALLAWWSLAGVDNAVGEAPVDWLRSAHSVRNGVNAPSDTVLQPIVVQEQTPATLTAFHAWLADSPSQPERRWMGQAILPRGAPGARIMVISDMPDASDMAAGSLFSDRSGPLFDAMLRAVGLCREDIYLTALALARPPGGVIDTADLLCLGQRIRAHVALVAPARLLLLGDRTSRAFQTADAESGGEGLRNINHEGSIVPVVATFHPRLLLAQPAAKAECWRAMQSLIEDNQS